MYAGKALAVLPNDNAGCANAQGTAGSPPYTSLVPVLELHLGDIVRLRKPHPCGGFEWRIVRLGADIGARCQTCDHRVMIDRVTFERRIKAFVRRAEETDGSDTSE